MEPRKQLPVFESRSLDLRGEAMSEPPDTRTLEVRVAKLVNHRVDLAQSQRHLRVGEASLHLFNQVLSAIQQHLSVFARSLARVDRADREQMRFRKIRARQCETGQDQIPKALREIFPQRRS